MDMTKENRNVRKIMAALVTGSAHGSGKIDVAYIVGEQLKEETLFYSGWRAVQPMQTVVDFQPFLHGSSIGYRVLGKTPEGIAETARQVILERLAGKNQKADKH